MLSQSLLVDKLNLSIFDTAPQLAQNAAQFAGNYLQQTLASQAQATIILATGNTQLLFLEQLTARTDIDWQRVICFHLDEYLGISGDFAGSFHYYLQEKFEKRVHPQSFHYLQGDAIEPITECDRYTQLLRTHPIDLCCLGIGSNGHLAFNEPSVANFNDPYSVKLVKLEHSTRLAQIHPQTFPSLETVPAYAFTVTLPLIFSARCLLCLAPGSSKAPIVNTLLTQPIHATCPASLLRQHPNAKLYLDSASASLFNP